MAIFPPEIWNLIFKHLRRLYFMQHSRRLNILKPPTISHFQHEYNDNFSNYYYSIILSNGVIVRTEEGAMYVQEPDDKVWDLIIYNPKVPGSTYMTWVDYKGHQYSNNDD